MAVDERRRGELDAKFQEIMSAEHLTEDSRQMGKRFGMCFLSALWQC